MGLVARISLALAFALAPVAAGSEPLDLDARAPAMSPWELLQFVETGEPLLIVDIRSAAEYSVSHLAGARRVGPEPAAYRAAMVLRKDVRHVRVVVYCTTGVRSQIFADGVLHDFIDAGAVGVTYLAGGIIAWSNARLPLVWRNGPTSLVHTHDRATATLLERAWLARLHRR